LLQRSARITQRLGVREQFELLERFTFNLADAIA
jgi:hypothetical protein